MVKLFLLIVVFMSCACISVAQDEIPLYSGEIPNSTDTQVREKEVFNKKLGTLVYNVSKPTLSVYLAAKESADRSSAVIIYPGGGYQTLLIDREGHRIARKFKEKGVSAFVVKYRLPNDRIIKDKALGPIQDAQKAIKIVRERAKEWNVNPDKIGVMGFSAGGHLAAMAGTHFTHSFIDNKNKTSLRPDFMLLIYPVISFTDSIGHLGSRNSLLGHSPSQDKIKFYSNELQVNHSTPPSILFHTSADSVVSVRNSLSFYEALLKNNVPSELHIYEKGEHGFLTAPSLEEWFGRCINWMETKKLL